MDADPVEPSISRIRAALDSLETAIERRSRQDAKRSDREEEFAVMQDDRSRLAVELDGALDSNRALAAANAAASERIAQAVATLERVLGRTTP
jgi:hypothetical protein